MTAKTEDSIMEAIFALGCKLAYGTYRGEQLGKVLSPCGDHDVGDIVFVTEQDDETAIVARPASREYIESGNGGYLTDFLPCVGTPKQRVEILTDKALAKMIRKGRPE